MMVSMTAIHLFEERGLGRAPFRFVQEIDTGSVRNGRPCEYCGTPLRYLEVIESSDGKRAIVGCECVRKTGDAGLIDTVKRGIRQARAQARYEKQRAEAEAALARQRERNGGQTDWERNEEQRAREDAARIAQFTAANAWVFPCLEAKSGSGFCQSMLYDLKRKASRNLSDRAKNIIADIFARHETGSRPGYPRYESCYAGAIRRLESDGRNIFDMPEFGGGPKLDPNDPRDAFLIAHSTRGRL